MPLPEGLDDRAAFRYHRHCEWLAGIAGRSGRRLRRRPCFGSIPTRAAGAPALPGTRVRPRAAQKVGMASAGQLKALLKSYLDGDDDRFFSVAMQVAAHEARLGHGKLAGELRSMIDAAKERRGAPAPIGRPRGELANLLESAWPKARLAELIVGEPLRRRLERIVREQRHAGELLDHGLSPRRKLLMVGPPGAGKTLTAPVLAGERSGIELLNVREEDDRILAAIFVPDGKLDRFETLVRDYLEGKQDRIGRPRDNQRPIDAIRRIRAASLRALWTDDPEAFPTDDAEPLWWEVWLPARRRGGRDDRGRGARTPPGRRERRSITERALLRPCGPDRNPA